MPTMDTKMRVTGISEYKSAMSQAKQAVKTLDDELKKAKTEFQQTGDKEQYMADKAKILQQQLKLQQATAKSAEDALKKMREQGVNPMNTAYQKMQQELTRAETSIMETTMALDELQRGEMDAAEGADKLTASVNGINKKISLDQVIGGIDKITTGLENAAKKAASLGQAIWQNIMDSAQWADDTATQAMLLDMNVEDYQKYKAVFDTMAELTVQDWMNAKTKVQNAIYNPSQEQADIFAMLGISTHETMQGKYGEVEGAAREWEDIFWEFASKLQERVENGGITQGLADTYFEALFGKKYANYKPLIDMGEEGFKEAVSKQEAVTEETINQMAELNDKLTKLKNDFNVLQTEVMGGLAPALEAGAEAVSELLGKLIEYVQSPEGQQLLNDLGTSVSGLFEDLANIDPESVVEGFTGVFNTVVDSFKWMVENKGTLEGILAGILGTWALAKVTGGALDVLKLINGLQGLTGGAAAAGEAGAAAGAAWGSAFAAKVAAAVPWLIGLYTMINPADTGNNDLGNANGLTAEGWSDFLWQRERANNGDTQDNPWFELITEAGEIVQSAADLWNDAEGIQALARYAQSGNKEKLAEELQALGYILRVADEELNQTFVPYESGGNWDGKVSGTIIKDRMTGKIKDLEDVLDDEELDWDALVGISPVAPEDAAEMITEQIGTVPVLVVPQLTQSGQFPGGAGGSGVFDYVLGLSEDYHPKANGIWSVPFDGYHAILHRGERVVPAREVAASRNYSSNLYVEKMYMNNGQDADGLAAKMEAAQRRTMNGFGS